MITEDSKTEKEKKNVRWLIFNQLHWGDTCFSLEGVPLIEVPLYKLL